MAKATQLRIEAMLKLLSDGGFHSGQSIADDLGISRTAVWKLVQKIQQWQVTIFSVRGRGYQIPGGLDLLDKTKLESALVENQLFRQVNLFSSINSTADSLAESWRDKPGAGRVFIAEHQTAGRGRKGRAWISPFGANLYFSVGVELPLGLSALGGLSLVVGMSLCKTINQFTQKKVQVKWPNDLLIENKKLAGILVEASGDSTDSSFLNIGVGVNWEMQPAQGEKIDQPWVNLKDSLDSDFNRNQILAEILIALDRDLVSYITHGFKAFSEQWENYSAMYKQPVILHLPNEKIEGVESGIESNGALKLKTPAGMRIFHSGEVSLRRK